MFNNALWQSRSHARQPLWFIMAPMIVFFIGIPFSIHFFGVGLIFGIDVALALASLAAVMIVGRKFRWNNNKLIFAFTEGGLYFTTLNNNNGSYFNAEYECIKGYSAAADGEFYTVTVHFSRPENAGVFGNITCVKMIKIENFDRLKEVFESRGIPQIA